MKSSKTALGKVQARLDDNAAKMRDRVVIYANKKQQTFLASRAPRKTFLGGRGVGKSLTLSLTAAEAVTELPGGKCLIAGLTFQHILTKTMPGVIKALRAHGFKEYDPRTKTGHYVKFRQPPASWQRPWEEPQSYKYVISFWNGFCIELMSLDTPDSARGGNYDMLLIDESALISRDVFAKVLRPMVRANLHRFRGNPYHQLIADFTSMPWLQSGQWVLQTEENMKRYGRDRFCFVEATTYDNLAVLGAHYIEEMRIELLPHEFAIEILNQRLKKVPNSFYPSFSDQKHVVWLGNSYELGESGLFLIRDNSIREDLPLEGSFDFNAAIGTLVLAQDYGNRIKFVDELYTTDNTIVGVEIVEESTNVVSKLIKMFADKYAARKDKRFIMYGDRGGFSKSAGNNLSLYDQIERELSQLGWKVTNKVSKSYPNHKLKHILIDKIMAGKPGYPTLEIDGNRCKYLIISIQQAGMTLDWTKDKRSERQAIDQRTATHASDAMDYLLYTKYISKEASWADSAEIVFIGR